jgi:hypothetical protein
MSAEQSLADVVAKTYMNRAAIQISDSCGCYSCLKIYKAELVSLWTDSLDPEDEEPGALRSDTDKYEGFTGVCPFCEDSSVVPSASVPELSLSLLQEVRSYWSRGAK